MKTTLSLLAATLGFTGVAAQAQAYTVPTSPPASKPSHGLSEIPDEELADMRGRYTIGQNTVAYFGVTMVSTWQSTSGQQLQAAMKVAIDATQNPQTPSVTFQPTVNITSIVPGTAPLPSNSNGSTPTQSSVNGSGLANVSGLTQGVQVAGDGNQATNVTDLQVSQSSQNTASSNSATGTPVADSTVSSALTPAQPQTQTMTVGNATVTSSAGPEGVQLLLSIANQGSVQQWIRSGSVGQLVQLTSDYQQVSNRMDITLVQQSLAGNLQLAQSVAQSLGQMH